jgi:transposase
MPVGEYFPDPTEGVTDPSQLPPPIIEYRSRRPHRSSCPTCGRRCPRDQQGERTLFDLGDTRKGRPRQIHLTYSKHYCRDCKKYFNADMSDLALPNSRYTLRVVAMAVRSVVEDGLPYRPATWHMWRDHRVYVPFATIQNWVEAAGKKKRGARRA